MYCGTGVNIHEVSLVQGFQDVNALSLSRATSDWKSMTYGVRFSHFIYSSALITTYINVKTSLFEHRRFKWRLR